MGEDFDNHRRIFDGGDDLQAAAAVQAVFDVDVEDPFEQPAPTTGAPARPARDRMRARLLALADWAVLLAPRFDPTV